MGDELLIQFILFIGVIIPTFYLNKDRLKSKDRIVLSIMGVIILCSVTAIECTELFFLIFEMGIIIFLVFKDILNSKILLTLNTSIIFLAFFQIWNFLILKLENEIVSSIEITLVSIILTLLIWNFKMLKVKEKLIGGILLILIIVGIALENYIISGVVIFGVLSIYFMILNIEGRRELKEQKIKVESLNEYIKNLEELNKETRKFKHDYINILATMNEFLSTEDLNSLRSFFEENIMPLGDEELTKNLRLGLLGKIKVCEFKSILISKIMRAYKEKVKVYVDIADEIESIEVDIISFCRIIGILLDNAIEAAKETGEKEVLIGIFKKGDGTNIVIENSFIDKGLYLHEMMREGVSSKGENRGLGLSNVNDILRKNSNIILDTSINRNKFIQHMIIY